MALSALSLAPSLHAAAMQAGKVQALLVVGDVVEVDSTGNRKTISKGDNVSIGDTVIAGPNSGATLVFSNGATMRVRENSQLSVVNFQQAPFDEAKEGTFIRLQRDPSQSITNLDLKNGTLQGEVKALNTAAGSQFTINTPAGSAGIRGTIVSISVIRDANGNITGVTANCATGNVAFTPAPGAQATATTSGGTTTNITNSNVDVNTGATIQISLTSDPTTGKITGVNITGAGATTAQVQAQVNDLFDAINAIRATENLPAIPAPTVTSTTNVTANGNTVATTTQANFDQTSANIQTVIPNDASTGNNPNNPNTPNNPNNQTTTDKNPTPTNPTVPVSPQGSM